MSYEHLVAGIFGGLSSTLLLHPLDLLKIRFAVNDGQSKVKKSYKGIPNAFLTICREEGFKGLYKGVTPNCIGSGSAWGLYFLFYNSAKNHIHSNNQNGSMVLKNMSAAAFAGILTTTITNPIWVIKTRLCLQYAPDVADNTIRYSGTWDAFTKIFRNEGFQGLYKGYIPGLIGVSHGAIQLAVYEELKSFYVKFNNLPSDHKLGTWQYLTSAALSKLCSASITYPYQVVRARLQDQHVKYDGLIDVIKKTWRYESYFGFYKGFCAYIWHVMPNICIVFFVYETLTKNLKTNSAT